MIPKSLPAKVVATMQAITAKAMREPAMQERLVQLGVVMQENRTEHYQQFMKEDPERRCRQAESANGVTDP